MRFPGKQFLAYPVMALALFLSGCSRTEEPISVPGEYETWERLNTVELDYPIPGHESNYRIIYINDKGLQVEIEETDGEVRYNFPEGTIIAKAVYEGLDPPPDAKPVMVTGMVKSSDHAKARGGWVWVVKNLGSGEERIIEEAFCYTCHAAANESHPYADGNPEGEFRDFVFFVSE